MRHYIILLFFFILFPSYSWSQGQILRPTNNLSSNRSPQKKEQILPNASETINGITVNWNGVTQKQKTVIKELLNNMVFVEGGTFMMGSDDQEAEENEKPIHEKYVNSFFIDKYETTQKLWKSIMGKNPSEFKGDNNPVEMITNSDCLSFINKLNKLTGLMFRLPTEAEWEYAAKGGNKSKGFKYSGSNNINEVAWYKENSETTHPVGSKTPNELGLYDMTGNVWEWTSDKFSHNYNSIVPESKDFVNRGGDIYSDSRHSCITYRRNYGATFRHIGLRLIL